MDRRKIGPRRPIRSSATRFVASFLLSVLHAVCLATLIAPPLQVIAASAQSGPTPTTSSTRDVGSTNVVMVLGEFAREAESLGLRLIGESQAEPIGPDLTAVKATAAVPLDQRITSTFFLQRTLVVSSRADLGDAVVVQSDLIVRYAGDHVTLEYADRFSADFDEFAGHVTGLAGTEVHRTADFDSPALEAYVAAQLRAQPAGGGAGLLRSPSQVPAPIEVDHYVESATIIRSDGTRRTYPDGQLDLLAMVGALGHGADLTIGCISDCFSAAGSTIGLLSASCLVAGLVVCLAACAASAGVACLPCIGGAGTLCGVAIAAGSLGVCIARCLNPSYNPPPPTATKPPPPRPTATPMPCAGDCDGDARVTVNELVRGVRMALGGLSLDACRPFDADRNGVVTVSDLVAAVKSALAGCGR